MAIVFPFVQFEFAHGIGPGPGRYLVRPRNGGEDDRNLVAQDPSELFGSADVLVVRVVGASEPRPGILRRSARYAAPGEPPREVALTVCTVIRGTQGLESRDAGRRMLASIKSSGDEQERAIGEALAILNRAVGAWRICAGDPYAVDVSRFDPRAVRVGYGDAEKVVAGAWEEALSIGFPPAPRVRREVRLVPVQEMAAVLADRITVLESEELLLRVILDLEHARFRAAAVGLDAATELLGAELSVDSSDSDPGDSGGWRERISALAERALAPEPLSEDEIEELRSLVAAVSGRMDAWRSRIGAGEAAGVST